MVSITLADIGISTNSLTGSRSVRGINLYLPSEEEFTDCEFQASHALTQISRALIEQHPRHLGHLAGTDILYLWKLTGGKHHRLDILAKALAPTGLTRYGIRHEFVIWVAADHLRARWEHVTSAFLEALLFHELCHLAWDEDEEKVVVVDHEFEGFRAEIEVHGFWQERLEVMRAAVQPRLFADDEHRRAHDNLRPFPAEVQ